MIEWIWTEISYVILINVGEKCRDPVAEKKRKKCYEVFLQMFQISWAKEDLCPVENPISNARRNLMVYDHNIYRLKIAQGVAINNRSFPLPRGSNLYNVVSGILPFRQHPNYFKKLLFRNGAAIWRNWLRLQSGTAKLK